MKQALISFLGNAYLGEYENCKRYVFEFGEKNTIDKSYRYIFQPLQEVLCFDKTFLFGTTSSMWDRLYKDLINKDAEDEDDKLWLKLKDDVVNKLDIDSFKKQNQDAIVKINSKLNCEVDFLSLDIRDNSELILRLGNRIIDDKFDKIVIDITHSYRYLPIVCMQLFNYLKIINRDIEIQLVYGQLNIDNQEVRIIDLEPLLDINNWITGAYAFKEFGKGYQIAEKLTSEFSDLKRKLNNVSDIQSVNYHKALAKTIDQFIKDFDNNESSLTSMAQLTIKPAVEELKKYQLNNDSVLWRFQLYLAKWQYDKKNYLASYCSLAEAVVSYVCTQSSKLDPNEYSKLDPNEYVDREIAKGKDPKDKNKNPMKPQIKRGNYIAKFPEIYEQYDKKGLRDIRNSLAHCTFSDHKLNYQPNNDNNCIGSQLKGFIDKLTALMK